MKNILNESPTLQLNNRMEYSMEFVSEEDISNKKILDIGCGFGWCELNFMNRGAKKIYGIEITEDDLSAAKKNINTKNVEFSVGSALEIPYPDNTFDTVVSWEVIEHIPKEGEQKMFSEVCRVLKPNGTFYLSTPYDHPISKYLDPAWWLIGHRHYSLEKLIQYGEGVGLINKSYSKKGGIWGVLSLLNMYFCKWILKRRPLLHNFFILNEKEEYKSEGFVNIFVKYIKM